MNLLNNDCIYNILLNLNVDNIINCSLTDKQFNKICKIELLWKHHTYCTFNNDFIKQNTWFDTYRVNKEIKNTMTILKYNLSLIAFYHQPSMLLWSDIVKKVPKGLTNLIKLKDLLLAEIEIGNNLELNKLTNLEELHLDCIGKKGEKINIDKLINLKTLTWGFSAIKEIPIDIFNMLHLEILELDHNNIKIVPHEIGNLINLKVLRLNSNPINQISSQIGKLTKLEILWFSDGTMGEISEISEISEEICSLPNLKEVGFPGCQIKQIPVNISHWTKLQKLYLHSNKIKEICPEIFSLKNLIVLSLSNNQIQELPVQITNLVNLEELYLYDNPINKIPDEIYSMDLYRNFSLT